MMKHPPLLILDKPCLGLDDMNRQLVLALIEPICRSGDTTVLDVNHRLQDAIHGIEHHLALGYYVASIIGSRPGRRTCSADGATFPPIG